MLIDLSLPVDAKKLATEENYKIFIDAGHAGTHFDVVNKTFPLESFKTRGKVIDVSHIRDREVEIEDLGSTEIEAGDFVIFHTGLIDEFGYNTKSYMTRSAELSDRTVDFLLERKVRLIGVDAAGVQKFSKHAAVDAHCADRGVFIVENLNNVRQLLEHSPNPFLVYTAPVPRTDLTGLPCRVLAEFTE
ncbi:MAG TPA: cyclase family protein [Candidatus Binataceae bacterium]|nr:cyclase family protein [Candidatus Binataceae bacterium]